MNGYGFLFCTLFPYEITITFIISTTNFVWMTDAFMNTYDTQNIHNIYIYIYYLYLHAKRVLVYILYRPNYLHYALLIYDTQKLYI